MGVGFALPAPFAYAHTRGAPRLSTGTVVRMSKQARPPFLTCTSCGQTAPRPEDGDHRELWTAGWGWIGSLHLYSCPACPPVILDQDGHHRLGPGAPAVAASRS